MRINKFLASGGVGSRRAVEKFILDGRVKINGEINKVLGRTVDAENDVIEVDGRVVGCQPEKVYIIMNKPTGIVTTCNDQFGRKTVLDLLDGFQNERYRVFPVGRLDYATEGLLLLTNDGEFTRRVTHPSSGIEKTYTAVLKNPISGEQFEKLEKGVMIDDVLCKPKRLEYSRKDNRKEIEITICEGRNRQVRRMFEAVGASVTGLKRVSIGGLTLGNLKPGQWRIIKKPNL